MTTRAFTRFVAAQFVAASGFAHEPDAVSLAYSGLASHWPAQSGALCPPMARYDTQDGWPA